MTRECEDCGETFETLSALRLHECSADESDEASAWEAAFEEGAAERSKQRRVEEREVRRNASAELKDALDRAAEGDPGAVHQVLAHYDRELAGEWEDEDGNYWALHRVFHEPVATALLESTRQEGWSYLCDVLEAYWPETTLDFDGYADLPRRGYEERHDDWEVYPHVSHVITNAAGRHLVQTRRTEGVQAIPVDVLDYMLLFHRHPGDEGAWVESMTYGWAIGHPDHPAVDSLVALVEGEYDIWVGAAVEHAFHADQHAAIDLLETVFERVDVSDPALLFRCCASIEKRRYPTEPQFIDWEEVYPEFASDGFDWDPDVRERVRTLVDQSGILAHREEWSFEDLEV